MKTETPYKKYVDEILGKVYESMGVKPHKRYPRKQKKRMKKGAANAIGWKAWKQYEAENKPFQNKVKSIISDEIKKSFVYISGLNVGAVDMAYPIKNNSIK